MDTYIPSSLHDTDVNKDTEMEVYDSAEVKVTIIKLTLTKLYSSYSTHCSCYIIIYRAVNIVQFDDDAVSDSQLCLEVTEKASTEGHHDHDTPISSSSSG